MRPEDSMAMQVRCVHCLCEQPAAAVLEVSLDRQPCAGCQAVSDPMTVAQYRAALRFALIKNAEGAAS